MDRIENLRLQADGMEKLLPPGTNAAEDLSQRMYNRFQNWLSSTNTQLETMSREQIYKTLFQLNAPDPNRLNLEIAYDMIMSGGDSPTTNSDTMNEKLLPIFLDPAPLERKQDHTEKLLPVQMTHRAALRQVKNEIAERELEEDQEMQRIREYIANSQ